MNNTLFTSVIANVKIDCEDGLEIEPLFFHAIFYDSYFFFLQKASQYQQKDHLMNTIDDAI
jgi:hypothetical protein